jgi:hypothetical protein
MSAPPIMYPPDDNIITEIIEAFGTFAFGDIEYNVEKKPISAFILCSCLIDQLACFTYFEPPKTDGRPKFSNETLYKRFITDYLPIYKDLNLYVNLRCKLVHNYTVGKFIKLTNEDAPYENMSFGKSLNVLTAKMMYKELKIAFDKIVIEFKDPISKIRKKAIECYKHKNSRIIAKSTVKYTTYTEHEASILIQHFTALFRNGINYGNEKWNVQRIDKKVIEQRGILVFVVMSNGKKILKPQIDEVIAILNVETSADVLNRLDPIQKNPPPHNHSEG